LDILARVDDNETTSWPSVQTALADAAQREREARVLSHWKATHGPLDKSELYLRAKALAEAQDKARTWRRR